MALEDSMASAGNISKVINGLVSPILPLPQQIMQHTVNVGKEGDSI